MRRAGLETEADARTTVTIEDVESAYEKSTSVHLSCRLNGLSQPEIALVQAIAELDGSRAGDVFEAFEEETGLQYTRFSELVNKLDRLGIINAVYGDSNQQGRSRKLTTTYSSELIEDGIED